VKIALLCATARGERFVRELTALARGAELHVVTFREEPWEPPFVEAIRNAAASAGAQVSVRGEAGVFDGGPFDLLIAVNWRYYVPREIRERAAKGAWVFHDALLPEYRGFSPTVWAIVNGEDHTGVTLLAMDEEIDKGGILDQRRISIGANETIAIVVERVSDAYIELLRANFAKLCAGGVALRPQDETRATYACKRLPDDNRIDWSAPSRRLLDLVRGVTRPYPGAWTTLDRERLIVWSASADPSGRRYAGRVPGRVVSLLPLTVLTGDGAVVLGEIDPSTAGLKMSSTLR
jgi:methionyl-tRNA formyltransferase